MADQDSTCCPTVACSLKLRLRGGKTLVVPRCALAAASPVLRQALALPLARSGELPLPDDDLDTWRAVRRVLLPVFITDMANWVRWTASGSGS